MSLLPAPPPVTVEMDELMVWNFHSVPSKIAVDGKGDDGDLALEDQPEYAKIRLSVRNSELTPYEVLEGLESGTLYHVLEVERFPDRLGIWLAVHRPNWKPAVDHVRKTVMRMVKL